MAPIGLKDRERGTVGFTTSLGFAKKLERLKREPRVALAYHAREHGFSNRPEYVLVQGRAQPVEQPTPAERQEVRDNAERHLGKGRSGPFARARSFSMSCCCACASRTGRSSGRARICTSPSSTG